MAFDPAGVPLALTSRPRWVCADWHFDGSRWTKVPLRALAAGRAHASATDPATWATFPEAVARAGREGWGVGFVLTEGDGIAAWDFDHAVEGGVVAPGPLAQAARLDSYTEFSVSGTGLHVYALGTLPAAGRRRGPVEAYGDKRFVVVTGRRVPGVGTPQAEERQAAMAALWGELFGPDDAGRPAGPAGAAGSPPLGDDDVIAKARGAANGARFTALWAGDTGGHGGDDSAADLALCGALAFWTQDEGQIDRLFRRSGLYRPKWERPDYRARTLARALDRAEVWQGPATAPALSPGRANGRAAPADEPASPDPGGAPAASSPSCAGNLRAPVGRRASEVRPERVAWLWPGRLALGKPTVLDGDPGLGKSTLTLDLAARVTTGAAMPGGEVGGEPRGVVLLSAEDGAADTIVPRLVAAGADLGRVYILDGVAVPGGPADPVTLPDALAAVEAAVVALGAALVVVDPLMAYLGGDVNAHRDQDVRRAMAPLAAMLERTGCAGLLVRHLNKAAGVPALYRGGGSIGIVGAARFGLLVARDPDDETARIVAPTKCNVGPEPPALRYRLEAEPGSDAARVVWDAKPVPHGAAALLAAAGDEGGQSAVDAAAPWLEEALRSGRRLAGDVLREARGEHSEAALRRAKTRLGVVAKREGFGPGAKWWWSLPSDESPGDEPAAPIDAQPNPIDGIDDTLNSMPSMGRLEFYGGDECTRCGAVAVANGLCGDCLDERWGR